MTNGDDEGLPVLLVRKRKQKEETNEDFFSFVMEVLDKHGTQFLA